MRMIHFACWEKRLPRNEDENPRETKTKENPIMKVSACKRTRFLTLLSERSLEVAMLQPLMYMRNDGTRGNTQGAKKERNPNPKATRPLTYITLIIYFFAVIVN